MLLRFPDDDSVDLVISFETIEHHDKHHEMMAEFVYLLRRYSNAFFTR